MQKKNQNLLQLKQNKVKNKAGVYDNTPQNDALSYSYKILSLKDFTEFEIKEKLKKKCFTEDVINEIIETLKEKKFIDDKRFTQNYVKDSFELKGYGKKRIYYNLVQKKIEQNIIEEELEFINDDLEEKKIIEIINKKNKEKDFNKWYNFFVNRGFKNSNIIRVLKENGIKFKKTENFTKEEGDCE